MRILHLTLKKKWFDMIASGEKKEEYREHKAYWNTRLVEPGYFHSQKCKEFDYIVFKNGYSKDARTMKVECKGIKLKHFGGNELWGAEKGTAYYTISLGKIIERNF